MQKKEGSSESCTKRLQTFIFFLSVGLGLSGTSYGPNYLCDIIIEKLSKTGLHHAPHPDFETQPAVSLAYTLTHSRTECHGTETSGVCPNLKTPEYVGHMMPQGLTLAMYSQQGLNS